MKKILFLFLLLPTFCFSQVAKHNSSGVNTFTDTRYVNIGGDVMTGPLQVSSLTVTGNAFSDKETEYLGNIALSFYNEFNKLGVKDAGLLTVAACILKSNALIAIAIRDKK